jgi:hypothetical protein
VYWLEYILHQHYIASAGFDHDIFVWNPLISAPLYELSVRVAVDANADEGCCRYRLHHSSPVVRFEMALGHKVHELRLIAAEMHTG